MCNKRDSEETDRFDLRMPRKLNDDSEEFAEEFDLDDMLFDEGE